MTTQQKTTHTPTPWDYSGEFIKTADNKTIIARVETGDDICHDSEFIVRAVNSHEELLERLREEHKPLTATIGKPLGHESKHCLTCQAIAKADSK